ncbi:hypothetical protein E9232_004141 [Inquilinus ginsengisoli]|uniref:Uncharacterized protein n=1 Tax=Inquilinus ginsengisoli TaxID=363840 RepID=A0ABU1JSL6_9PROT|nr:hypothetical protein [Inquilinus ginsengisoli]
MVRAVRDHHRVEVTILPLLETQRDRRGAGPGAWGDG